MVMRIYAMRMTLLGVRVCIVPVRVAAVTVTVVVEEEETDDVGCEAARSDDKDDDWVRNVLWLDKSLDGFEEDGETQRDQEDTVDQGT
jgi:hypothetical protein